MLSIGSSASSPSAASCRSDRVRVLSDGRVYTGRQAVREGLIDALGGEDDGHRLARKGENTSQPAPRFVDWAVSGGLERRRPRLRAGQRPRCKPSASTASTRLAERAKLDGLLVLWHAQSVTLRAEGT